MSQSGLVRGNLECHLLTYRHSDIHMMLSLPKEVQVEVARSIDHLAETPRPSKCKKLVGSGLWRVRVGQLRVVYAIDDKAHLVTVVRVARRTEDTCRGL